MTALSPSRIITLCKFPHAGRVKTRLIPSLGEEGAAALQRRMVKFVYGEAVDAARAVSASVEVCYEGADEAAFRSLLGAQADYFPQEPGDLGARIHGAFVRAFRLGFKRAVLTGSDCPCAVSRVLQSALSSLLTHDAVVGPAEDGGYYLIGLAEPMPFLFEAIPWSTEAVFDTTVSILQRKGRSFVILEPGWDVDRPEDVVKFEALAAGKFRE